MKNWPPQDQVFWYLNRGAVAPLAQDLHVDVAIIGGGMAGLSAAQAFNKKGKKVAVFEQYYCGSGATGKSSGFITPNAELSLTDFSERYSIDAAHKIWQFITSGVDDIRANIKQHNFVCDYTEQNSLVVANSKSDFKTLVEEHKNLEKCGYTTKLYTQETVRRHLNTQRYYGGVEYEDTFGINAYLYCQELKKYLQSVGILIYEETPVAAVHDHTLRTLHATVTADYIIVCADRFTPDLGFLEQEVYHAQTFLLVSQQLTDEQIRTIFPAQHLMVWDTDLIYSYFRLTGDKRLLVGGGSLLTTYASKPVHEYARITKKLINYIKTTFPTLDLQFEQHWPGLIGLSKDIGPLAGRDKNNPHIYCIAAAAGLPIAAALGRYSADHLLDGRTDLDTYFSPYRSFPISGLAQSILGNKISFALSNLIKKNVP